VCRTLQHMSAPSPFQQALGEVVRMRRHAAGLTQEQLAAAAGMHVNYVSQIERGGYRVTVEKLRDLASGLNTTASSLIDESELLLVRQST
jgi:transcriptional regulator with XRE-family HTH domain